MCFQCVSISCESHPRSHDETSGTSGYGSSRPSQEKLNSLWAQGQLFCDACSRLKAKDDFHKTQQKYSLSSRKCIQCIDEANHEALFIVCVKCEKRLHREEFFKSLRNSDRPICKPCKQEMDIESSKMTCTMCGISQLRDAFRKKVDWESPKCASCLAQKEKRDYEEWQKQREEDAVRRAELRDEMAEDQLRDNFQSQILKRMESLPQSLLDFNEFQIVLVCLLVL